MCASKGKRYRILFFFDRRNKKRRKTAPGTCTETNANRGPVSLSLCLSFSLSLIQDRSFSLRSPLSQFPPSSNAFLSARALLPPTFPGNYYSPFLPPLHGFTRTYDKVNFSLHLHRGSSAPLFRRSSSPSLLFLSSSPSSLFLLTCADTLHCVTSSLREPLRPNLPSHPVLPPALSLLLSGTFYLPPWPGTLAETVPRWNSRPSSAPWERFQDPAPGFGSGLRSRRILPRVRGERKSTGRNGRNRATESHHRCWA